MKHRGRIHFAMLLSSFEPYPLEYFTTGLHLQVEFGCHRCHENGRHLSHCCCEAEDDAQEAEEEEDEAGFHMARWPRMVDKRRDAM